MPLHTINSIAAYGLIILSVIRYYTDIDPEPVFMMPVFAAVILLIANNGIQYDQRPMMIIAFVISALLTYYFGRSINTGDPFKEWEVLLMFILTAVSTICFIIRFLWLGQRRS